MKHSILAILFMQGLSFHAHASVALLNKAIEVAKSSQKAVFRPVRTTLLRSTKTEVYVHINSDVILNLQVYKLADYPEAIEISLETSKRILPHEQDMLIDALENTIRQSGTYAGEGKIIVNQFYDVGLKRPITITLNQQNISVAEFEIIFQNMIDAVSDATEMQFFTLH